MNRIASVIGGGLIAAVSFVGFAIAQQDGHKGHDHSKESADAKQVTVTGELIDTACYVAADGDAKGKDHAECASKCMATGIPAGILPEGSTKASDMMFLLTNPTVFAPYAAQTIKVQGKAHPGMHAIDVKKAYVKDGAGWKEIKLDDEHHKMGGDEKKDGHKDHKH